jgi:hypothetical protein
LEKYSLYGLTIESDVKLIQLVKAKENSITDVYIKSGKCADEVTDYLEKAGALEDQYEIGMQYSCFMNMGGYYIIRDGSEIIYETKEGYSPEDLSTWLLGFSFAMLLLQRKTLAIHCSAVCGGDKEGSGAILIAGDPGAGKSSLTKKLMEDGYKIMADDVAAVKVHDEIRVYPAFPYQKLVRNEVDKRGLNKEELIYINEDKDKFLVPVGDAFCGEDQPIGCMFYIVVADVPELSVKKLSGLEQFMAFRRNLFLHRLSGAWENDKEVLDLCLKATGKCPVYLLIRPNGVDSVGAMANIVEKAEI